MDNQVILEIDGKQFKFRLKSQKIVELEKVFGKNIFEIFQMLSFSTLQIVLWTALDDKSVAADADDLMDILMTKYSIIDLSNDVLQEIAIKSGLLKKNDVDDINLESTKNA